MLPMIRRLERWQNRAALVTGASSGIGWAASVALAELGMKVAIAGRRVERLALLREQLEALGAQTLTIPGDQTDMETNRQMFRLIRESWGGVDVLINNAGVTCGRGVTGEDFAVLERCLDLNLKAALLCMQEAAADMRPRQDGAIINISSLNAHRVIPARGAAVYAAAKHALRLLTDGLRAEFAEAKLPIKVAAISPGLVATEFHRSSPDAYAFRPLMPQDVSDAVLYILAAPPHVQVCDILLRSVEQVD